MKTIFISTLILFIFLFSYQLRAQDDYVVTQKGDTLRCTIKYSFFDGSPRYKVETNTNNIKINPLEIKEYRKGNKKPFRSVKFNTRDKKPIFLEVYEDGKISLYKYVSSGSNASVPGGGFTSNTSWYVNKIQRDTVSDVKTDMLFMSKSRKNRKNEFGEMLKDDSEVYQKYISDDKFSLDQIISLIHQYNIEMANKK